MLRTTHHNTTITTSALSNSAYLIYPSLTQKKNHYYSVRVTFHLPAANEKFAPVRVTLLLRAPTGGAGSRRHSGTPPSKIFFRTSPPRSNTSHCQCFHHSSTLLVPSPSECHSARSLDSSRLPTGRERKIRPSKSHFTPARPYRRRRQP